MELALGLVVFTVVGVGFFGEVDNSSDAARYGLCIGGDQLADGLRRSIGNRRAYPHPPRLMLILKGEAQLNDASGLAPWLRR